MRRLSTLAAALMLGFAVSNAHAVFLSVDQFNAPPRYMHDMLVGLPITMFDGLDIASQAATPLNRYSDPIRAIQHNWTVDGGGGNLFGSRSSVTIGTQAAPMGSLSMANNPGHNSIVDIRWTLASGFVPAAGPVSFLFNVVFSDSVPVNISYALDALPFQFLTTFNQSVSIGSAVPFGVLLSAGEQANLANGGLLTLRFAGDAGWDLAIDSFGFQIPEPTSLALVGLALLGAGVMTRRRKA